MTIERRVPSPARDLARIHRAITRSINIGIEKGAHFSKAGFQDGPTHQGFSDYGRSLATVLGGHHEVEDVLIFPAFQKKLPSAPYEHLASDHKLIEASLVWIHRAVDEISGGEMDGLDLLVSELKKIKTIWAPHIRMEESIFSHEALCEVMTEPEQGELVAEIGKFSKERSVPPYLIVPFVLFNLNADDRAEYLLNMPPNVMDDLVLKAWKGQWSPMRPFLLK